MLARHCSALPDLAAAYGVRRVLGAVGVVTLMIDPNDVFTISQNLRALRAFAVSSLPESLPKQTFAVWKSPVI